MTDAGHKSHHILFFTVIIEGALVLITYVWSLWRAIPLPQMPTVFDVGAGMLFGVALLGVNLLLFSRQMLSWRIGREFFRFRSEVIIPLVRSLQPSTFLPIAILAGLGEEMFFRGLLLTESGCFASSIVFAVLHFGGAAKRYPITTILYALIGALFAMLATQISLTSAIIAHGFYDLLVLIAVRRQGFPSPSIF